MPITLAIACRSWRQTVFRSPELWSYFRLPLYKQIPRYSKGYTEMVIQQLRGGRCLKSRYGIDGTINRIVVAVLTKVNIRHLKFVDVDDTWPRPCTTSSPAHFWPGYSNLSYFPRKVLISLALVSCTTRTACLNVHPGLLISVGCVESLSLREGPSPLPWRLF